MKKILGLMMLFFSTYGMASCVSGCKELPCMEYPTQPGQATTHDFHRVFNQKRYWLEKNKRGKEGDMLVCSQRVHFRPEPQDLTTTPTIMCSTAIPLEAAAFIAPDSRCWYADGAVLCRKSDGMLHVYTPAVKTCGKKLHTGTVLGTFKQKSKHTHEQEVCTVTLKQ